PDTYDYRRPYGASRPAPVVRSVAPRAPYGGAPREDFSPEPYERRPLVEAPATGSARGGFGAPSREPPDEGWRGPPPTVPPLGPSRGAPVTGVMPVAVSPAATLACPIVSELDRWIATAVQPAAMRWLGS